MNTKEDFHSQSQDIDTNNTNILNLSALEATVAAGDVVFNMFNKNSYVIIIKADGTVVKTWDVPHMPFPFKPGEKIREGTITKEALDKRVRISKMVDKEKSPFGFGYAAVGIPFFERDGRIAGSMAITSPIVQQDSVKNISQEIQKNIEQSSAAKENISGVSKEMNDAINNLSEIIVELQQNIGVINDVTALMQDVASQTNLLGLNASIEAARAGEYGVGFTIVADEIVKMANASKDNMRKVRDKLNLLNKALKSIEPEIESLSSLTGKQLESVETIDSVIDKLMEASGSLGTLANQVWI